ncbi:MAG: MAPEG family protein [Maritimibacter sp.]|nr:MAPEG family protein [Maritimibacter sp.]
MLTWIFVVLAIYYIGLFLPSLLLLPRIGIPAYVGSRDADPEPHPVHARAIRAHRNLLENLAPFLGLAVLALLLPGADGAAAARGAMIFAVARAVYLPLYLAAVPWLRSLSWTVGFVGLAMMALALV